MGAFFHNERKIFRFFSLVFFTICSKAPQNRRFSVRKIFPKKDILCCTFVVVCVLYCSQRKGTNKKNKKKNTRSKKQKICCSRYDILSTTKEQKQKHNKNERRKIYVYNSTVRHRTACWNRTTRLVGLKQE